MEDIYEGDNAVCVIEPKHKTDKTNETKRQPPYVVIIYNDNDHTVPYVIEGLQKVFGYSVEKAVIYTAEIHHTGRSIVWSGTRELAELKQEQLVSLGPDLYGAKPVEYPLGVTIEPAT
jgi:ATP-dependent Clp protease adaptor protein ClpS